MARGTRSRSSELRVEQDGGVIVDVEQPSHRRRQRHEHLAVLVAGVQLAALGEHADHLEGHTVDEQPLADRRFVTVEVPRHRVPEDRHARRFPHLLLAEEIARNEHPGLHREKIRFYAVHGRHLGKIAGLETQARTDQRRGTHHLRRLVEDRPVIRLPKRGDDLPRALAPRDAAALRGADHDEVQSQAADLLHHLLAAARGVVDRGDGTGDAERRAAHDEQRTQRMPHDLAE